MTRAKASGSFYLQRFPHRYEQIRNQGSGWCDTIVVTEMCSNR
jgi:hypothetical protein